MKYLIYPLFLITFISYSQVTSIPDEGFEEELIEQSIDSDGTINGEVLTSDISDLTSLSFTLSGFGYIYDLTGIEDFISLETLDITGTNLGIEDSNSTILNLTNNTNLIDFTFYGTDDNTTNLLEKIDLSNNLMLNNIVVPSNWYLRQIDLKSGTTDVSNLNIDISIYPVKLQQVSNDLFCIKVTNASQATAGQGVYSTWNIIADNNPYYFSETCTLSTEQFDKNDVVVYPNPTQNEVFINSTHLNIQSVSIYNLNGQLMKTQEFNNDKLDIGFLQPGVYLLSIKTDRGVIKKKIVKI